MNPSSLGKATNLIRKLRDEYYAKLDEYDVLILPTIPRVTPKLPPVDSSIRDFMLNTVGLSLNTSGFNLVSF